MAGVLSLNHGQDGKLAIRGLPASEMLSSMIGLSGVLLGGNAMYTVYETRDGGWVALGSQELKFAVNLLSALCRPDLIETCKLPPGKPQHPVRDFLRELTYTGSELAHLRSERVFAEAAPDEIARHQGRRQAN